MHKDFTTGVTLYEWCDMTDNLKLVIFKKESNGRSDLEGNILLHSYKLSLKQHKQTSFKAYDFTFESACYIHNFQY